jgi:DNA transposition AAA+ family ATPase
MIEKIKSAIGKGNIEWQKHALERMLERGISRDNVKTALLDGDIINVYPADKPYSSCLVYGEDGDEPYHVVVAYDEKNETCFIITVYRPDSRYFESDFKTRKI